jgi:hypothetical protein
MQSLMEQRIDGLQALRLRAVIATSEFYSLIGKDAPVQKVRFQVKTVGPKAYHIVDWAFASSTPPLSTTPSSSRKRPTASPEVRSDRRSYAQPARLDHRKP